MKIDRGPVGAGGPKPGMVGRRGPLKLTNEFMRDFPAPERGSAMVWDAGHKDAIRGFGARFHAPTRRSPGGARSFFFSYTVNGFDRRVTIGEYPTMRVGAARERAVALRQQVLAGEDPATEKRENREAPTMQDLVDRYVTDHLKLPVKPEGKEDPRIADHRRMLNEMAEIIGKKRKVKDVHFGDVEAMHRKITDSGRPVRANRVLQVGSKAFWLSLAPRAGEDKPWRSAVDGNPCKGVRRNREEPRERFFSQAELAAIADALEAYPVQTPSDCVRLIMLTGCRPSEALRAKWSEFDAEPGFWTKPSAHTKQRKVHKAPLAAAALELITRRRKERDVANPWVFPGAVLGEPLAALWHVWHFVRDRAGLGKDAHVYTLRHTFASVGAGGGLSLPIIGRLLGHTQSRTTQRYAHLADEAAREAANKIGAIIAAAGRAGASVAPIKGRRSS
jgi:integrase